jgi:methylated-DNA-[protein]-cysteine S-methyltransferase
LVDTIIHTAFYSSPIGILRIEEENDAITVVSFIDDTTAPEQSSFASEVLASAVEQLHEYFAGTRTSFTVPLQPAGTNFQQSVWKELLKIQYADVATYLQMAKRLGNVKAIRAAASANGKNPIGVIIPCHRVIGAEGKLTGYAGGLHRKQWLLEHEAKIAGKQSSLF